MIVLTVGVGLGLGFAQALMPATVKARFATRPAHATGIYVMGFNIGSALVGPARRPDRARGLGDGAGRSPSSRGVTIGLVFAWWALTGDEAPHRREASARVRLPWRDPLAWQLVGIFGSMACVFYGLNNWLSDAYVERGWSDGKAGALWAVLNIAALVTTLTIPWFADRYRSRRFYLVLFSAAPRTQRRRLRRAAGRRLGCGP